jgi:hypothetical protein
LLVDQHVRASGEHGGEDLAHAVPQFDVTPSLAGLTFQGISLPVHFGKDVVNARKILPRGFQAGFGQLALGFELRNTGGFFDETTAIHGLRAEELPDASLLDDRVTVVPQSGA